MTAHKEANEANYIRHIHPTHREAIKEYFEERYSVQELVIMYRDVLHNSERIAIRQVRALTKGIKQPKRI